MASNGTPVSTLATRITIDDMQAVNSLRGLKNQVSTLMNSWKAQNAMLQSVGDHLGAAKAKYEGLGDAIQKQEEYITKLKSEMETIDASTNKGSEAYARLTKQLSIAQKQLANLNAQQERAKKSMDYYASGADKVKASLKEMTTSSNLMIEKLKAEGKTYQANYEQSRLYANQLSKMSTLHDKLKSSLNTIAAEQGKESDAYKRTASSLQKLDTEMAKTKSEQSKLNSSFSNTHQSVAKMRDSYDKASTSVRKVGTGVKEMAGKVVSAGATAGMAVAGLSAGFVAASKSAASLQNTYKVTSNLLQTGGEKTAEVTKNVAEMQKDGRKYSLEYGVSQKEIAAGYEELTKKGYSSAQSLGSMKSMIQASVASGDDFNDVVKISTGTLEAFGMKVDSTRKMAANSKEAVNELAYAADKTSTSFADLGVGMSYVGSTAHQSGISLSETASALGTLSNQNVEASKAGTGLRRVIQTLTAEVNNINNKDDILAKLGMKKSDLVDSSGKLKSLSSILGTLNDKTKNMGKAEKGALFKQLFGEQGANAAAILAENADNLGKLNNEVEKSTRENYVGKLATKNMGTAENAMKRFKAVSQDVQMTLASVMLPTVSKMAESMSKVADTKGFRSMMNTLGNGIGAVGNQLQKVFGYVEKNSGAFTSMGKSISIIVGQLGSGIWSSFKGTLSVISKGILTAFGDKSTGNVAKDLANAMAEIAKHKDAIKAIGEVIGTVFVAKKISGFAKSLYDVGSAITGITKSIGKTKGGNFLGRIFGITDKAKISKDVEGAIGDIADGAKKAVDKKSGKTNFLSKMFKKSSKDSSDVAKDAGELAKDAGKAAEKESGKTSFLSKIFSKTPKAEQGALSAGTRMAAKVGNGLNIGLAAIDLTKGIFEKNGKKKFEDIGSSLGSLVGTGIGTFFGGPVGGAIGGMIGNTVGKWIGDAAHGAVKWWNKEGGWSGISKNISKTVTGWGKTIGKACNDIGKKWNKLNRDMVKGVENIGRKVGKSWNSFWKDITKTATKNSKAVTKEAQKIGKGLNKEIQSATKKAKKSWNSFWKDAESLAKKSNIGKTVSKTFRGIEKSISDSNKRSDKDIDKSQNTRTKAFQNGSKKRSKLIDQESKNIIRAVNDETKKVINAANNEYKKRVSSANNEYSQVVKKANQTRDQAVKAANDKYNHVVKAAQQEYSGTDRASTQQRNAIIAHAKKQRDDSVNAANDQRDTIKTAAKNQSKGVVDHATNQANSTMKANSEQSSGVQSIWNKLASFFNSLTKPFGVKPVHISMSPTSYPSVSGLAYASGGGVSDNGKALVGEAGPELRYKPYSGKFDILGAQGAQLADLEAGDEILNADDTAKLLSGNFKGTLPGYAKGTSDLGSFIKKIKNKAEDIFDDVKDEALDAIKKIGNPIDKLKDIAKKAFNLDSVKDLGSVPRDISKGAVDKSIKSIGDFISKLKDEVTSHIDSEDASLDSNSTSPKATGDHKHWVQQAGIPMKYWDDVNYIVSHESGWNPHATNASSGAYGLPQSLPAGKMAAAGKDWRDNPITQLKWMYSYVNSTYGGFPQAHAFWLTHHAYANGGIANEPSIFGEDGPEMAIPLASPKRSRGYELIGKVAAMFAADEQTKIPVQTQNNDRVEELLDQNNKLMETLINIATGQLDVLNSGSGNSKVAKDTFYRAFGMDQQRSNFQSF